MATLASDANMMSVASKWEIGAPAGLYCRAAVTTVPLCLPLFDKQASAGTKTRSELPSVAKVAVGDGMGHALRATQGHRGGAWLRLLLAPPYGEPVAQPMTTRQNALE